jgi:uncharacterized membrane protein
VPGFLARNEVLIPIKTELQEKMMKYLKLYLVSLAAFFAIDMLWLGLVARSFYQQHLGFLMAPSPNWFVAIIFYLLFLVGLMVFVVLPMPPTT